MRLLGLCSALVILGQSNEAELPAAEFVRLGDGECRDEDGSYPLKLSKSFYGSDYEEALALCHGLCSRYEWCVAFQLAQWSSSNDCGLVTDYFHFYRANGFWIEDTSWGAGHTIDDVRYSVYCSDNPCPHTVYGAGSLNFRNDRPYECWQRVEFDKEIVGVTHMPSPAPTAIPDDVVDSSVFFLLGDGECRDEDGSYPLKLSKSVSGDSVAESVSECAAICERHVWCLAFQLTIRSIHECGLVTDYPNWYAANGEWIEDTSWAARHTIDEEQYSVYCNGNGHNCPQTVYGAGSINVRSDRPYYCYQKLNAGTDAAITFMPSPMPTTITDEVIDENGYVRLGDGVCKDEDGSYPLKLHIGFYDERPVEMTLAECEELCNQYSWCLALEVEATLNDHSCGLISDYEAFTSGHGGEWLVSSEWGDKHWEGERRFTVYCNGGGSTPCEETVYGEGSVSPERGYACYRKVAGWTGGADPEEPEEPAVLTSGPTPAPVSEPAGPTDGGEGGACAETCGEPGSKLRKGEKIGNRKTMSGCDCKAHCTASEEGSHAWSWTPNKNKPYKAGRCTCWAGDKVHLARSPGASGAAGWVF